MKQSKVRKIYFGFFWTILIVSFVFFATLLILFANGYYFNLRTFHLQKTGMIVLKGNPAQVTVTVNAKSHPSNFPIRLTRLFPGRYDIKISKDNYHTWEKIFQIEGGQAVVKENINLFLQEPIIKEKSRATDEIQTIEKNFKAESNNLTLKDNEIWRGESLVTRFSQKILGAILDESSSHIYVQLSDEIRVIDNDGSNNILLLKLQNSQPTAFSVSGVKLDYIQNGAAFEAKIR